MNEFKRTRSNSPCPKDGDLPKFEQYLHPKLLDTTIPPAWDDPDDVAFFFSKIEINCLFLDILYTFQLNIDNDADTEFADRILTSVVTCESIMRQILNELFSCGIISEETLHDTKNHLFDIILEYPDLLSWYTQLVTDSVQKRSCMSNCDQMENIKALVGALAETCNILTPKLRVILMDKLFGNTESSCPDAPEEQIRKTT